MSRRIPKYRRYKPKNLGLVVINGRQHYLGPYGTPESVAEYNRLIQEFLAGGHAPDDQAITACGRPSSVNEEILVFRRHGEMHYRQPDGSRTGELQNFRDSLRPLRKLYGPTDARDFSPRALKAVRQSMIDSGLARSTINQRIGRVVHVFKWACSEELVPVAVYQALKTVSGLQKGRTSARETEPVQPVSDEIVDLVRPHVSRQVWAMIEIQRHAAIRPGEVVIMRTGDLDRSEKPWVYAPNRHKTAHRGKHRAIHLGPRAPEILTPWLKDDPSAFLFSPAEARAERYAAIRSRRKSKVPPSQRERRKSDAQRRPGVRYSVRTYHHAIARACDATVPHPTLSARRREDLTPEQREDLKAWRRRHRWHPNQLRHSSATAIRSATDLDTARTVLGHSRADTIEIYAERDRAKAAEVMERIG